MIVNSTFHWHDVPAMLAFVAERGFAHIFAATPDGPKVAHAPVEVTSAGALRFHVSRRNVITPHLAASTVIISIAGDDFYVSPDWYTGPDEVPTWNYVAVEAEGPMRLLDQAELTAHLDGLSATHEAKLAPKPIWTRHKMGAGRFEAMLPAIMGFEMATPILRGMRKLGQNKKAADRAGMIAALELLGRPDDAARVAAAAETRG